MNAGIWVAVALVVIIGVQEIRVRGAKAEADSVRLEHSQAREQWQDQRADAEQDARERLQAAIIAEREATEARLEQDIAALQQAAARSEQIRAEAAVLRRRLAEASQEPDCAAQLREPLRCPIN